MVVRSNWSRIWIQWNAILCAKTHTYVSDTRYKLIKSSWFNTSGTSLAKSASSCNLEAVRLAQLVRQFFRGRNVSEDVCSVPPLSLESWPVLWSHLRWLSRYSDRNGYSRGDQTCGRTGQSVSCSSSGLPLKNHYVHYCFLKSCSEPHARTAHSHILFFKSLRLIHTYHAVSMLCPCRSPAMPRC
jgi:hypothetical protein